MTAKQEIKELQRMWFQQQLAIEKKRVQLEKLKELEK